jgi:hypothetical protein
MISDFSIIKVEHRSFSIMRDENICFNRDLIGKRCENKQHVGLCPKKNESKEKRQKQFIIIGVD